MITPGTLLIEKGTTVPQFFPIGTESYPNAWKRVITNPNFQNSRKNSRLRDGHFFTWPVRSETIAFGFDKQKMHDTALRRLIANVTLQKCNCLEIDKVSTHSFLGMPYDERLRPLRAISKNGINP